MVLTITGRDGDGGLLARPRNGTRPNTASRPLIAIRARAQARQAAPLGAGVGDRVLARIFARRMTDDDAIPRGHQETGKARAAILGVSAGWMTAATGWSRWTEAARN
jgi:hypothetical protein